MADLATVFWIKAGFSRRSVYFCLFRHPWPHTRKAEGSAVDSLLGTTGISAACDCIWQLQKKPEGEAVLKVTGREVEEDSFALRFSKEEGNFGWQFTGGNGAHDSVSPKRRQIV